MEEKKISYGFADNFGFTSPFGEDSIFSQQSRDKEAAQRALQDESQKLVKAEPKFESGFKHETFYDKQLAIDQKTKQINEINWRIERTTLAMDVINATGTATGVGIFRNVNNGLSDAVLLRFLKQLSAEVNKIWYYIDKVNHVVYEFNLIFPNDANEFANEDFDIYSGWKFENKYPPADNKYRRIQIDKIKKFQIFRANIHDADSRAWAGTVNRYSIERLHKCGVRISVAINPNVNNKVSFDWDEPLYDELEQHQKCVLINPKAIIRTFAHELFTHFFDDSHLSLSLTRERRENIAYSYWKTAKEERRKWLKTFTYYLTDEEIQAKATTMSQNQLINWVAETEFRTWIKNFDKDSWKNENLPANLWNDQYQKVANQYPNIVLVRKYVTHTPEDDGSDVVNTEYHNVLILRDLILSSQNITFLDKDYDKKAWKAYRKTCLLYPFLIQLNEQSVEISLAKRKDMVAELKRVL